MDLQINLLVEYEITQISNLIDEIATKLEIAVERRVSEYEQNVAPPELMDRLQKHVDLSAEPNVK